MLEGFKYSPQTGIIYRSPSVQSKGGAVAYRHNKGYLCFRAHGRRHLVHRAAVYIMTGIYPERYQFVDHRNRRRDDNRWGNLRLTTNRQNSQNTCMNINKLVGCTKTKKKTKKPWHAQVKVDGVVIGLGVYFTEIEAHTAHMNYLDEHGLEYLPEIDKRKNDGDDRRKSAATKRKCSDGSAETKVSR